MLRKVLQLTVDGGPAWVKVHKRDNVKSKTSGDRYNLRE